MIKLQDYTPDVYYRESRDFQFIGRLYDLVLNYSKTNVDLLYDIPLTDNTDDQFISLLGMTLGFRPKHKYTSKHLRAVCSVLADVFRNKGTLKAVTLVCNAIFNAEGITNTSSYKLIDEDGRTVGDDNFKNITGLVLYVPTEVSDNNLLNDLFDYILPAGMSADVIKLVTFDTPINTALEAGSNAVLVGNQQYRHNLLNGTNISLLPQESNNALVTANPLNTQGMLVNMQVFKPSNKNKETSTTSTDNTDSSESGD